MEREYAELLVHAKKITGTSYITINNRSFYVMLPFEAFDIVYNGHMDAELFEKFTFDGNHFYIAEVTLWESSKRTST